MKTKAENITALEGYSVKIVKKYVGFFYIKGHKDYRNCKSVSTPFNSKREASDFFRGFIKDLKKKKRFGNAKLSFRIIRKKIITFEMV